MDHFASDFSGTRNGVGPLTVAFVVLVASLASAANPELVQPRPDRLVLIEPGPAEQAVLHADGSIIEIETETVWRYMCGSDTGDLTIDDLRNHVRQVQDSLTAGRNDPQAGAAAAGGGLDIAWAFGGGLSAQAIAALESAASVIESQFGDPITVTISVQMFNFGNPNIIGSTGSSYAIVPSWTTVRNGLIAGMDADDTIQAFLPSGSTIPVRYNASSATITNETRVFFTRANFNAAIGAAGGTAAGMQFNSGFAFDFDPSNGITGGTMDFQSIVVHEVGHALGFTSGVDFRSNDMEALDIFRFQRTDGAADYNPDTTAEFQVRPRTVDFNNLNDDANSDLIGVEYRMSDGSPFQASHFRENFPNIGVMDPAIAFGESFYPDFFKASDLNMFDAIGYDYPLLPAPTLPPFPDDATKNRYISFLPNNGDTEFAFQVEMTSGPGALGVLGWAGEPDAEGRSLLVGAAFYTSAWPDPVHVGDCGIVPVATYAVRAIPLGADEGNPASFSSAVEISTIALPAEGKFWGDSVGELIGLTWTFPNGVTNFQDVVAVLQAFAVDPTAPPSTWADIHPEIPNRVINIDDTFNTILAFQGLQYPFSDPLDCP